MAEMFYRTTTSLAGPWLIDINALDSLDEILDAELEKLSAIRKRELENEIRRELNRLKSEEWHRTLSDDKQKERERELKDRTAQFSKHSREKREVVVTLKNGEKIRALRFSDVYRQPNVQNARVESCSITIACGEFEASVSVPKYSRENLEINVEPAGRQEAAEFFVRLEQWGRSIALPRWIAVWKTINGLQWSLFLALIVPLFLLALTRTGGDREEIRKEAAALLQKGIGPDDQQRALTLILSLLADYPSGPATTHIRPWFWFATGFLLISCILSSFPPKSEIGVGNGVRAITLWRRWIRFISVVIPAFALMGVLSSAIGSAVFEWIKTFF